jgi:hypothetical protein
MGCGAGLGNVTEPLDLGDTIYLITTLTLHLTQYSWVCIPLNSYTTITIIIPFLGATVKKTLNLAYFPLFPHLPPI